MTLSALFYSSLVDSTRFIYSALFCANIDFIILFYVLFCSVLLYSVLSSVSSSLLLKSWWFCCVMCSVLCVSGLWSSVEERFFPCPAPSLLNQSARDFSSWWEKSGFSCWPWEVLVPLLDVCLHSLKDRIPDYGIHAVFLSQAHLQPSLLGNDFTHLEFPRRVTKKEVGKRMLYRDFTMNGWWVLHAVVVLDLINSLTFDCHQQLFCSRTAHLIDM